MKQTSRLILGLSLMSTALSYAQMPSFDDFVAPVAADPSNGMVPPTEAAKPEAVKVSSASVSSVESKTPVIEADSAQDAVISANQKLKELKRDIAVMKVGSGQGFMATGRVSYRTHKNRQASLEEKRDAYVRAYIKAKANLAQFLYGLRNDSRQDLQESVQMHIASDQDTLVNRNVVQMENIEQIVEGMLRGFVVYEVEDDLENKEIRVVIVTTPKTQGRTMRTGAATILAENLRDGMQQVFAELKAGIVPPVGGRVITVPMESGEQLYFIAFGSSIIPVHNDVEIARELRLDALEEAEMRATANLCSLIVGDETVWRKGMNSQSEKQYKEFSYPEDDDPTAKPTEFTTVKLDEARKSYVKVKSKTNAYISAQSGRLPPGLTAQKWVSEDGDWAFAAYIYNPYTTAEAESAQQAIQGPSILERGSEITEDARNRAGNALDPDRPSDDRANQPVGQGPSGRVSQDEDL